MYHQDHLPHYGNNQSLLIILEGIYRNRNKTWLSSLSSIKEGKGKLKQEKMNLLGLMISNISKSGKHTFLCRIKSFEFTAGFIIFLGSKTNTALYKEVQASSSPKNTRNTWNIIFSCMKIWDGNKPVGFEAGERQKQRSRHSPATSKPWDRHKHVQAACLKVRCAVHGYLDQVGEGSDKGTAAPFH